MGDTIVEVPGQGNVAFPDSMSDADISAAISKLGGVGHSESGISRAIGEFSQKFAGFHPIDTLKGAANAVMDLPGTFAAISHQTGDLARKAQDAYKQGDYGGAAAHAFNAALNVIPGLGTAIDEAAEKGAKGDWAGMVGDTAAVAANIGLGKLVSKAPGAAASATTKVANATAKVANAIPDVGLAADVAGLVSPRAAHGLRILGRIQHAIGSEVKPGPVEAAPAVEPPSRIVPGEAPPAARPDWRQGVVDDLNKGPEQAPEHASPTAPISGTPEDLRNQFIEKHTPKAAPAEEPQISGREAANREKLARDLADFLHSKGEGITHADALRMGPDEWKLAKTGVRPGSKAGAVSPATVKAALGYLEEMQPEAPAAPNGTPKLSGRSLDLAQQLKQEMGQ